MTRLRNANREKAITRKRLYFVITVMLFFYTALLTRVYHLQVKESAHYKGLAQKNKSRTLHPHALRAQITDRYGRVIGFDKTHYFGCYAPQDLSETEAKFLNTHALQFTKTKKHMCAELESWDFAHISHWESDTVKQLISPKRNYPYGDTFAHIVGYTSRSATDPFDTMNLKYEQKGVTGIEKVYDNLLIGHDGNITQYVDAKGRVYHQDNISAPVINQPVALTLDYRLQQKAQNELFSHQGSIILLDPRSGEILAAASSPSFDPHNPSVSTDHSSNMINRITQVRYPPASTIKPFLALMALEDGLIDPDATIEDPGFHDVGDKRFHDWKRSGHGTVNLDKALIESCDVYFYQLAQKLGINRMVDYFMAFKFDQPSDIDISHEKKSLVPTHAYRKARKDGWYEGHTIMAGIGQGDFEVTPVALARATMLLANKGYDHQLHIAKSHRGVAAETTIKATDANWEKIHHALSRVMREGTGRHFKNTPYAIAGKTGSAQVKGIKTKAEYQTLPKHQKDHHLFIGFSPVVDPEVAIVVIIEHEHQAVRIAKHMLDFYWQNTQANATSPL